jgi:hypothetical protein
MKWMDDGALSDMSKYGGIMAKMPTNFRETDIWQRLQVSCDCVCSTNFCVHGANCSYERENGERDNITYNEFK